MFIPLDLTVEAYFPNDDQSIERPSDSDVASRWFQNAIFGNESRAVLALNDHSNALECATKAFITTRVLYELPSSSSESASHDPTDVPIASMASFIQYIPTLAHQYLYDYETSVLTNERRAALSAKTAASSPQVREFLSCYARLNREHALKKHEANYVKFAEEVITVGCLLAEAIDNEIVQGLDIGWTVEPEDDPAHNTRVDFSMRFQGKGLLAMEVKQAKAGESLLRAIEEYNPIEGEHVILGAAQGKAPDALRKVNFILINALFA